MDEGPFLVLWLVVALVATGNQVASKSSDLVRLVDDPAFVCRTSPFTRVPATSVADHVCDCCDCSDEASGVGSVECDDGGLAAAGRARKKQRSKHTKHQRPPDIHDDAVELHDPRYSLSDVTQIVTLAEAKETVAHHVSQQRSRAALQTWFDDGKGIPTTWEKAELINAIANSTVCERELSADAAYPVWQNLGWTTQEDPSGLLEETDVLYDATMGNVQKITWRIAEALASRGTDEVRRGLVAMLVAEPGYLMLPCLPQLALPEGFVLHWAKIPKSTVPDAEEARALQGRARAAETVLQDVQSHLQRDPRRKLHYGPAKVLLPLDGRCFDVPAPASTEPDALVERPSEVCIYRYARYKEFAALIDDLRVDVDPPAIYYHDTRPTSPCWRRHRVNHTTLVSFACHTDEFVLYSTVVRHHHGGDSAGGGGAACTVNVTLATPAGC